jgi:hypothetical protein
LRSIRIGGIGKGWEADMNGFPSSIPWGRDVQTGKLVRAERAIYPPGKGRYRCLDEKCGRDLTVARSKQGRQHFRHFRNSHAEGCVFHDPAKSKHSAAIRLLVMVFTEALKRRTPMPLLVFNTPTGAKTVLPFVSAEKVVPEWTCPNTGRRADLALLDHNQEPVLLVEVWHTHAVPHDKQADLAAYWWIEVEAKEVLMDSDKLIIRNHGNLPVQLELAWKQFELFR